MSRMNMPPGPGRPKGMKNKATILKEERRAIFDAEVSKVYLDTIAKAKPEYLLDQFIGKSPDKIEIDLKVKEPTKKIKEVAEKLKNAERPKL